LNGWGAKGGRHIEGYNNVDEMTSDDEDDASEQDYGDDEEEDEHVSLASDVDDPDDLTDVDEEEVDDDEEKHLIVKLPVKTPTPERKTTVKIRMSPDNDSKPLGLAPNANQGQGSISTAQPASSAIETKENTKPPSSPAAPTQVSAHPYGIPAKAMSIPPKSPPHQNPISPLAFRGSPEKPASPFPKSIDVGYGGS
jgi:hypothetical protein